MRPVNYWIFLGRLLLIASAVSVLLWPAWMNHGPFFYTDTRSYMRTEDSALAKILHHHTDWTSDDPTAGQPAKDDDALHNVALSRSRSLSDMKLKGIMLGRSVFWGTLLYIGSPSGFWLTVFLQSLSVVTFIALILRHIGLPVWRWILPLSVALALTSDAGFYASFLMPDVYAGIALFSMAVLLSTTTKSSPRSTSLWFALLLWCFLSHDSLWMLGGLALVTASAVNLLRRNWSNRSACFTIAAAILCALVTQKAIALGIQKVTHQEPLRFPLLEARLIADGPGTQYLKQTCPQNQFAACKFVSKYPLTSQDFMYCAAPECSAYETAGYETRRRISNEQIRLFLAVARFDPLGLAASILRNAGRELLHFPLSEFSYNSGEKLQMQLTFPEPVIAKIQASPAFQNAWPEQAVSTFFSLAVSAFAAWILFSSLRRPSRLHRELALGGLWTLALVVGNALICGGVSDFFARYQARVIWTIPLAGLLIAASQWNNRRAAAGPASQPQIT